MRTGAEPHVAFPMIERFLGGYRLAIDCENGGELNAAVGMLADVVLQPVHEAGGFIGEAEADKRVDGEGGVANPGEAIVPVARAADDFGEAGCRRGDDRTGGFEGEELEDESRALDALAPAAAIGTVGEPVLPKFYGALEGLLGFAFGGGAGSCADSPSCWKMNVLDWPSSRTNSAVTPPGRRGFRGT